MKEIIFTFNTLKEEIGLFGTIFFLIRFVIDQIKGEPFKGLDKSLNEKEVLSRNQIGPAILLYKNLLKNNLNQRAAYKLTEKIVIYGTLIFLKKTLGPINQKTLNSLNTVERDIFVKEKGDKFFNAKLTWDEISGEKVKFTVSHCLFPILCNKAGVPELSPVFCQGDAHYFGTVEEGVELNRPHTLAEGGPNCPFTLKWKK